MTAHGPQPKRHHWLPKFYLRGFADQKRRIRRYARGSGSPVILSLNDAAVQCGFYTLADEFGEKSQDVELLLSKIEGEAQRVIQSIIQGGFPPATADRWSFALFMALQITRTPEWREESGLMHDTMHKVLLEGWTPDYVRQRLVETGQEPTAEAIDAVMDVVENPDDYLILPHQNEQIVMMLQLAVEGLAPVLAEKCWLLGLTREGGLVTSDHPVAYYSKPSDENRLKGVGLANAEEVHFPLDRSHVLMLAPEGVLPERATLLAKENVLFVNSLQAASSYRWVFQHPGEAPIGNLMPKDKRPLFEQNGRPVFGHG